MDSILAAVPDGDYQFVLVNYGANDVTAGLPAEATWVANYQSILDKAHVRFPDAQVYVMRPWRRGFGTQSDTLATWIASAIVGRAWAHLGPDERVWMEGGDDGATMTSDGTHYSTAGDTECAAQWQTVLGY